MEFIQEPLWVLEYQRAHSWIEAATHMAHGLQQTQPAGVAHVGLPFRHVLAKPEPIDVKILDEKIDHADQVILADPIHLPLLKSDTR